MLGAYVSALVAFAVVDLVWVSTVVPRFYQPAIRDILAPRASALPAIMFFLLYPIGLVVFVVLPATDLQSVTLHGALLGLICYATYDLTNQSTLRAWPAALTVVDVTWGALLSGFAAACSFWVARTLA